MVVTCKNTGENKETRKNGKSPAFKLPGLGNNSPLFTVIKLVTVPRTNLSEEDNQTDQNSSEEEYLV